ncbi:hypothetical protein L218DRAFT_506899 [Marasmius fiardii PR-910]|nr:hypothetical protein L218DRAFT_506899 [Marasmius fiardii PR-910]
MLHLSVDSKTLLPSASTPDTKALSDLQDPSPLINASTTASDATTPAPAPQNIAPLGPPEISITPSPADHQIPSQLEIQNTASTAHSISPDSSLYSIRPPAPNELLRSALPFIAVARSPDLPANSIKKALELLDRVSKVHPISEIAWFVISSAFRVVIAQHERDQEIVDLFDEMSRVYETATTEDILNRIEEFSTLFDAMVMHTTDCCIFISNYSSGGYFSKDIRYQLCASG